MKTLELLQSLKDDYVNCFKLGYVNGSNWKEIDEAIKELEEFENRSCESCTYYSVSFYDGSERSDPICTCQDSNCNGIFVNRDFCCNRYKPKDNNESVRDFEKPKN